MALKDFLRFLDNLLTRLLGGYEQGSDVYIHRIIYPYAIGKRVLEIGTGSLGIQYRFFSPLSEWTTTDITLENLKRIGYGVNCDACYLPFKDNSFDAVLCKEVLEHIKDDSAVIREIKRVSKIAIITTPCSEFLHSYKYPIKNLIGRFANGSIAKGVSEYSKAMGHVRDGYSYNDFKRIATDNGMELIEVDYISKRIGALWWELTHIIKFPVILRPILRILSFPIYFIDSKQKGEGVSIIAVLKRTA